MNLIEELCSILRCPDDGSGLQLSSATLRCVQCGREYPILADNVVELLSSDAVLAADDSSYGRHYPEARAAPFEWRQDSVGWGAPESFPEAWVERKYRQVAAVKKLTGDGGERFADFSAGAGYYTLEFAKTWRYVLHCDLSAHSLTYARRKAAKFGLTNILFVRMDYLRPAFRRSLDCVACLDSLIRGETHERLLLEAVESSLAPEGSAVVDFHNWWHNPVRRLGLLRNNFGANRSYRIGDIQRILASAGITGYQRVPFHQEVAADSPLNGIITRLLPPTRWMYRFGWQAVGGQ